MTAETRLSLLDTWIQENNAIVKKWEQRDSVIQDNIQTLLKRCHLESHKLLRKIQGIPAVTDHVQLELTVVYNCCVFSLSQSQLSEAEQVLTQGLKRGLEMLGWDPPPGAGLAQFWSYVSAKPPGGSAVHSCLQQLLCFSWALWLATCQLAIIQDMQEALISLSEGLGDEGVGERRSAGAWREKSAPPRPQVVLDPRELRDILQICTVIAQGADWLVEGRCSEALCVLQTGPSLPAPRVQLAHTHFLSGLCLARTGRPQSALQCFRKAMEVDSRCVSALHQSILVYQQLGNTQAEIQGLHLLHSMLVLPPAVESGNPLLRPSSLPRGQSLSLLLSVPSPLGVLHSLALKNVLHGRLSEGAELYLDLLAELQSGDQHTVGVADALPLPRLAEVYLEAGSALLAAKRPADALALCDEVIITTLDLLPNKRLNLEEEELGDGAEAGSVALGRLETVLWAGSAHLLQAHCQAHLKDWKQAVELYTRCINLVVKVCVLQKDGTPVPPGADPAPGRHRGSLLALRRLKGLALAGRGISFTQRDQLREALRDLQLSLQASAGCMQAELWLGEVLWRLGRKREATGSWQRAWSSSGEPPPEGLPLYLQDPQSGPSLDPADLQQRLEEFTPLSALEGSHKGQVVPYHLQD
ncbi:Fanconi anemia group G protein isoform X3 [Osmerus eperlanus]|uniref:Fanconi anemia group G protein isoform X3 n=1 Tax=Osmerus eperlanus TaxID=29151 RepID=UPI002E0E8304